MIETRIITQWMWDGGSMSFGDYELTCKIENNDEPYKITKKINDGMTTRIEVVWKGIYFEEAFREMVYFSEIAKKEISGGCDQVV